MKKSLIELALTKHIRKIVFSGLLTIFFLCSAQQSHAQFYSVKTNLLEWGMLGTINAEASMMVAPRLTVNFDIACNPWTFKDNMKLKHWLVEPGLRYWFWQTYTGGFVSLYGIGTRFNGGFNKRYDGHGFGVGATYGYAWAVGKRWNIEAEIGIGALWSRYGTYECVECGMLIAPKKKYLKPSPKASIGIVYLF
ncbi:MAG: DUF3575 domain-containing protein [Rikenellaceae bacterium]